MVEGESEEEEVMKTVAHARDSSMVADHADEHDDIGALIRYSFSNIFILVNHTCYDSKNKN